MSNCTFKIKVEAGKTDNVVNQILGTRDPNIAGIETNKGKWDIVIDFKTDNARFCQPFLITLRSISGITNVQHSKFST